MWINRILLIIILMFQINNMANWTLLERNTTYTSNGVERIMLHLGIIKPEIDEDEY